jgi:hypothetical protein
MESLSPSKLIKAGFWLGLGFIGPTIIAGIGVTALMFAMPSFWQMQGTEMAEKMMEEFDKTDYIRIVDFRESMNGNQVLILGTIENTGPMAIGSIQIEAELLDAKKVMVFECSEYISKKLKPAEKESFQVKCGCGNQPVPAHDSMTVRVVKASTY